MAIEEVGARLTLRDRLRFSRDARGAAEDVERIGEASEGTRDRLRRLERAADRAGGRLGTALGRGTAGAVRGLGVLSRGLFGLGQVAAVGTAAAGAAIGVLGVKVLQLATDAGETESKFKTVFGSLAPEVTKFNDTISARFGVTTKALQDATSLFGVFGQGAGLAGKELLGFSTGLVQAALDLGSFYNVSSDEAFGAIQSGLSGEAEPLRRFSIFMSEAGLQAFAASRGIAKSVAKMTEQEKVALRGSFILANLGKAQGDLARTGGGLANQQRALSGRLEETGTILGKALLPAATEVVTVLNRKLAPVMTSLQQNLPGMTKAVSAFADRMMEVGRAVATGWKWDGLDGAVRMLDQVTGSGGKLEGKFQAIKTTSQDAFTVLTEVILPKAERTARLFAKALGVIADHAGLVYKLVIAYSIFKVTMLVTRAAVVAYNIVMGVAAAATGNLAAAAALSTAGQKAHRVAMLLGAGATKVWSTAVKVASGIARAARLVFALMWAAATGPVGLVIGLIALVVGGLVLLYKKSDLARSIMNRAFALILDGVAALIDGFASFLRLLGKIPGFGWAKTAADSIGDAADKTRALADNLRAIPANKTVSVQVNSNVAAVQAKLDRLDGPRVQARAMGGPVRAGQPYIVGERQPELFVPRQSGMILPSVDVGADLTRSMPADGDSSPMRQLRGQPQPLVVQVVLDRRVLGEAVINDVRDRLARA